MRRTNLDNDTGRGEQIRDLGFFFKESCRVTYYSVAKYPRPSFRPSYAVESRALVRFWPKVSASTDRSSTEWNQNPVAIIM
mmetsp:Transcript_20492/g.42811  ORF Transcript_20492/g.42811 Transcript_20492/m.42811 type:complete len:81 (-) Transcript_20492:2146-2388(-)